MSASLVGSEMCIRDRHYAFCAAFGRGAGSEGGNGDRSEASGEAGPVGQGDALLAAPRPSDTLRGCFAHELELGVQCTICLDEYEPG
eukprot:492223-Alexandrium_andersonii.AAC.1